MFRNGDGFFPLYGAIAEAEEKVGVNHNAMPPELLGLSLEYLSRNELSELREQLRQEEGFNCPSQTARAIAKPAVDCVQCEIDGCDEMCEHDECDMDCMHGAAISCCVPCVLPVSSLVFFASGIAYCAGTLFYHSKQPSESLRVVERTLGPAPQVMR